MILSLAFLRPDPPAPADAAQAAPMATPTAAPSAPPVANEKGDPVPGPTPGSPPVAQAQAGSRFNLNGQKLLDEMRTHNPNITDDEAALMRHLVRLAREQHQVVDERLARLVDIDPAEVWRRLEAESGELSDIVDAAERVASVDGAVNAREKAVISELQDRCDRVRGSIQPMVHP